MSERGSGTDSASEHRPVTPDTERGGIGSTEPPRSIGTEAIERCIEAAQKKFRDAAIPDKANTELAALVNATRIAYVDGVEKAAQHVPWSDGKCSCGQRYYELKDEPERDAWVTFVKSAWADHIRSLASPESLAARERERLAKEGK